MSLTAKQQIKRKNVILGTLTVGIAVIALFFVIKHFYKSDAAVKTTTKTNTVGIVKLADVIKNHPRYNDIRKLEGERSQIAAQMSSISHAAMLEGKIRNDSFANFTQQKAQMRVDISNKILQNKMIDKEKQLREQLAPQKAADFEKISSKYQTPIFNYTLQLDNAKNLRLSPTQIDELNSKMMQLKKERAAEIHKVGNAYENMIKQALEDYYQAQLKEMQAKITDANKKDAMAMEKTEAGFSEQQTAMLKQQDDKLKQQKQDFLSLQKELTDKNDEIKALKEAIYSDIRSKAAIIAQKEHLSIIFADRATEDLLDWDWNEYLKEQLVVSRTTKDITSELITELKK